MSRWLLAEKERFELFFVFSEIVVNSVNEQIVIQIAKTSVYSVRCGQNGINCKCDDKYAS